MAETRGPSTRSAADAPSPACPPRCAGRGCSACGSDETAVAPPGKVHRAHRQADIRIVDTLARDLGADALLRLIVCGAEVRVSMNAEPLQARGEPFGI